MNEGRGRKEKEGYGIQRGGRGKGKQGGLKEDMER